MYEGFFGAMVYWFFIIPLAVLFALTGSFKAAGWLVAGKKDTSCPTMSLLTQLVFLRLPAFLLLMLFDPRDAISVLFTGTFEQATAPRRSYVFAPPTAY